MKMSRIAAAGAVAALSLTTPFASQAQQTSKPVPINVSTDVTVELVPKLDTMATYVTHFNFVAAGTTNVTLVQGTGANCGTGQTSLTGAYNLTAQSGIAAGGGRGAVLIGLPGRAICIINSAVVQVSGAVSYTQF